MQVVEVEEHINGNQLGGPGGTGGGGAAGSGTL
jgi:hypothetical protein